MKEKMLIFDLVQGGADAYVEVSHDFGKTETFFIDSIEVQFSRPDLLQADGKSAEISISIKNLSAIGNIKDEAVKWYEASAGIANTGYRPNKRNKKIKTQVLWAQLDSTGTGVALECSLRLNLLISESE